MRDHARKSHADPLTSIPSHIRNSSSSTAGEQRSKSSRLSSHSMPPPPPSSLESRLNRESSERDRAQALIRRKQAERARLEGSATPSTVHGGYADVYNRAEVEDAHRGWGRKGWERDRDLRNRRWIEDERDIRSRK